jgi:predicted ester cyclase
MVGLTQDAAASMSVENKSLIRAFVEAVNAQDWPRVMTMLAPDFKRHSAAAGEPGVRSATDLVAFLQAEFVTFPDATETLLDLVAEGDRVAARHHFRGTQLGPMGPFQPSGKVLSSSYLAIYRIENQRIAEAWAEWDNLTGLKQLGHQ